MSGLVDILLGEVRIRGWVKDERLTAQGMERGVLYSGEWDGNKGVKRVEDKGRVERRRYKRLLESRKGLCLVVLGGQRALCHSVKKNKEG